MESDDFSAEQLLKKKVLSAAYGAGSGKVFIRVFGGGKKDKHVHIDVVRAACFGDKPPRVTHKATNVQAVLDRLIGKKISVGVTGAFVLPVRELPPEGMIRSMLVQKIHGKLGLSMTGGTVSVQGAPVERMEWSMADDGKGVFVSLTGAKTVPIQDDYLVEVLKWIVSTFDVFVLEKESRAAHKE